MIYEIIIFGALLFGVLAFVILVFGGTKKKSKVYGRGSRDRYLRSDLDRIKKRRQAKMREKQARLEKLRSRKQEIEKSAYHLKKLNEIGGLKRRLDLDDKVKSDYKSRSWFDVLRDVFKTEKKIKRKIESKAFEFDIKRSRGWYDTKSYRKSYVDKKNKERELKKQQAENALNEKVKKQEKKEKLQNDRKLARTSLDDYLRRREKKRRFYFVDKEMRDK